MLQVELIGSNGSSDSSKFFSLASALNYYNLAKGGKYLGGAIVRNNARVHEFGLLRDGTTVREARKILRERAK